MNVMLVNKVARCFIFEFDLTYAVRYHMNVQVYMRCLHNICKYQQYPLGSRRSYTVFVLS